MARKKSDLQAKKLSKVAKATSADVHAHRPNWVTHLILAPVVGVVISTLLVLAIATALETFRIDYESPASFIAIVFVLLVCGIALTYGPVSYYMALRQTSKSSQNKGITVQQKSDLAPLLLLLIAAIITEPLAQLFIPLVLIPAILCSIAVALLIHRWKTSSTTKKGIK